MIKIFKGISCSTEFHRRHFASDVKSVVQTWPFWTIAVPLYSERGPPLCFVSCVLWREWVRRGRQNTHNAHCSPPHNRWRRGPLGRQVRGLAAVLAIHTGKWPIKETSHCFHICFEMCVTHALLRQGWEVNTFVLVKSESTWLSSTPRCGFAAGDRPGIGAHSFSCWWGLALCRARSVCFVHVMRSL